MKFKNVPLLLFLPCINLGDNYKNYVQIGFNIPKTYRFHTKHKYNRYNAGDINLCELIYNSDHCASLSRVFKRSVLHLISFILISVPVVVFKISVQRNLEVKISVTFTRSMIKFDFTILIYRSNAVEKI